MRRVMQVFFGAFTGNTVLAVAGFMGPAPYWPGIAGAVLAGASLIALTVTERIDTRSRDAMVQILSRYRKLPLAEQYMDELDRMEGRIVRKEPLVKLAHDMGELRGKLIAEGRLDPARVEKVESDI